jgi:Tol biopolymer transport system component
VESRQLIHRGWHAGLLVGLGLLARPSFPAAADAQRITLREGTDIAISAPAGSDQLSIDLVGRIWVMDLPSGRAHAVTDVSRLSRRPAFSPDGRRIAFEALHSGFRQIMLMDADGSEQRQITFGDYQHSTPVWHPDGSRLVITSDRGGSSGLWEIDAESLSLRQLTFSAEDEFYPAWNAAGTRLVYVRRSASGSALYTLIPGAKPRRVYESTGQIHTPAWRPDESVLTYVLRDAGISELRMLIMSEPPVSKPITRGENVFSSPAHWIDRDTFLYTADGRVKRRQFGDPFAADVPFAAEVEIPQVRRPSVRTSLSNREPRQVRGVTGLSPVAGRGVVISALGDLWELDAAGDLSRQLTTDVFVNSSPALSPDGRTLAFVSDRGGDPQLWLMERDGGAVRRVTRETGIVLQPSWSADGKSLLYPVAEHAASSTTAVKRVGLADGDTVTVINGLPGPVELTTGPNGTVLVVLHPAGSGLVPTSGKGARLIQISPGGEPNPIRIAGPDGGPMSEISEPHASQDGRNLAFIADGALYVVRLAADGRPADSARQVAPAPTQMPRWTSDERVLVYLEENRIGAVVPGQEPAYSEPLPLTWLPAIPVGQTVIRAGRIYDGIAPDYIYQRDVIIQGNRIVDILPWSDSPPEGTLIDARDQVVMPGLIDLAVRQSLANGARLGHQWLAFGVTNVRETVSLDRTAVERLESWASGRRPGPRLFIDRLVCELDQRENRDAAVEAALSDALRGGATFIRVCADTATSTLARLISSAHEVGLMAAAPGPFPAVFLGADEVPLGRLNLGYPAPSELLVYGDIVDTIGEAGAVLVSRLSAVGLPRLAGRPKLTESSQYRGLFSAAERYWYEQSWRRQAATSRGVLGSGTRTAGQALFRAVARGGRVTAGSDAPLTPFGMGLHAELALLVDLGLQPFQVMKMATLEAARALGIDHELGSIEPGKMADLVIVGGDPLRDISDAVQVRTVLQNGHSYTIEQLLDQPRP